MSLIDEIYANNNTDVNYNGITIGIVVDTNDPQQMGRIRVRCPAWNEKDTKLVGDIPWAMYGSPFGGASALVERGPNKGSLSEGKVAYGMWNIPKVGSLALVMCVDGNPLVRVWLGCIFDQYTPHTMPHGRFVETENNNVGPLSSLEQFIQPLSNNQSTAFGELNSDNHEWKTRGADYSVSAVDESVLAKVAGNLPDDKEDEARQGYDVTRTGTNKASSLTTNNLDSQVYAWTTPSFHAISMDDKGKNSRMRFRTSAGHQIILDDTNERLYIMTAEGNNYIELDQSGNIDIYSKRRVSVHSEKDINMTSDEKVRIHGKKGVHIESGEEIRFNAATDMHITSNQNVRMKSAAATYFEAQGKIQLKSGDTFNIGSGKDVHIVGTNSHITASSGTLHLLGSSQVLVTGGAVHLNGPSASGASAAAISDAKLSNLPNRVPMHEPWPRVMYINTDDDNPSQNNEFTVNDESVGKIELGETIERGENWRR